MTLDLEKLHLGRGGHDGPDDGACLLEAASMLAGEPFGDTPACVSPVLGAFGRSLNDVLPDVKRQALKPLIPSLVGTAGDGQDEARSYMALDWLVRTYLPSWLRLVPALTAQADLLAQHAPITDLEAAAHIGDIVRDAASQADAAAVDAAVDAAWAAARAAARAAAVDAAVDAAWAAARAAAVDAAVAAARAAARDVLAPTVEALQDSAIALYAQMITPVGGAQ